MSIRLTHTYNCGSDSSKIWICFMTWHLCTSWGFLMMFKNAFDFVFFSDSCQKMHFSSLFWRTFFFNCTFSYLNAQVHGKMPWIKRTSFKVRVKLVMLGNMKVCVCVCVCNYKRVLNEDTFPVNVIPKLLFTLKTRKEHSIAALLHMRKARSFY